MPAFAQKAKWSSNSRCSKPKPWAREAGELEDFFLENRDDPFGTLVSAGRSREGDVAL